MDLSSGARIEVRRGSEPVLLARLRGAGADEQAEIGAPFTDRLVVKFGLPVAGWRGRGGRLRAQRADLAAARRTMAAGPATTAARQRDEEPGGDA